MPTVRVRIALPYLLRLGAGEYQLPPTGTTVVVEDGPPEAEAARSAVSAVFAHPEPADIDEIERFRRRDAEQLLGRTNRLLRWYRAADHRADLVELTRAQASPFRYEVVAGGGDPAWLTDLRYEQDGPTPLELTTAQLTAEVQAGLAGGQEPDVAVLFLLDAEHALRQGRFREAVLFSWSTIDSVFNRKYEAIAKARLAGEWSKAREFFIGHDFGMRNKMSAGLHLLVGRSLAREPGDFWQDLSTSYDRRNDIIHRGENVTENEGRQAIRVARRVVAIMGEIPIPALPAVVP